MANRVRRTAPHGSTNGQPPPDVRPPANPSTPEGEAARLLQEAVANPGSAEIPEEPPESPTADYTIPEEEPGPADDARGELLDSDPALMTVQLGKPSPQSWVQLSPRLVYRPRLLAYKERRDSSAEYYWVPPSLRRPLRRWVNSVFALLVFDTAGDGESFLWVVPQSSMSPYYAKISVALSKGEKFCSENLFCFEYLRDSRRVSLRYTPRTPDDPAAVWPSRPLGQLLYEALGPDRRIEATTHPVYSKLTAGGRLE
jgi:hypothetical protein